MRSLVIFSLVALASACANGSNPTQPSGTTSVSPQNSTSSVVAPRPLAPANASQIRNADQPVVLTVINGLVTGNATATYTFEVATDQAFSNKVQVKDGVPQGASGQTSVRLDALAAATDYYWHARAQGGGTTGVFSGVYKFSIGPAILIQAPTPVGPLNGAVSSGWPTFTVSNAARSGPAGPITYRFDISANQSFTPILLSGIVPETPTATSFTPPSSTAAPAQRSLYWRATAFDQTNGVSGPPSATQNFTYTDSSPQAAIALQAGYVLWPGAQPPGSTGHSKLGGGWDVRTQVSFNGVSHLVPTLEELRVYDLIDRGMNPYDALAWMNAHGYPTDAAYYPGVGSALGVIGFPYEYMTFIGDEWELVVRVGA